MKGKRPSKQRGFALLIIFSVLAVVAIGTTAYISSATQTIRLARTSELDTRLGHVCEAGLEDITLRLWKPLKVDQRFESMDIILSGASPENPRASVSGTLNERDVFAAGVIGYREPDSYTRMVTIRSVAWEDRNSNQSLDPDEPRKIVDVTTQFSLTRSAVFDYTYFINNYGWWYGFSPTTGIINGDMRANGDFEFRSGVPTTNGSIYASRNDKLTPPAAGIINMPSAQWDTPTYRGRHAPRMRQGYDPSEHGAFGSPAFERWRDFLYDAEGRVVNNRLFGAILGDSRGHRNWNNTVLDPTPTRELVMPDLSDLSRYIQLSQTYIDERETFENGRRNPDFGRGAYLEVWDENTRRYVRVDNNGVVEGSAVLIGTNGRPIRIHGPVTFTQDCVIRGVVSGQGVIYAGRNVHVVGDIIYKDEPDFRGPNPEHVDRQNSDKDILALCARGSIIMGDVSTFDFPWPLQYMTPPFTRGRLDEFGNFIPPYNALERDETGRFRYQSVYPDAFIHSISEPIQQLDCIMYTNFMGGGNLATGGAGIVFNGSIISKDEAMVIFSAPLVMNYDNRIRERRLTRRPLIDLNLPRTPELIQMAWQDHGTFVAGGSHGHS